MPCFLFLLGTGLSNGYLVYKWDKKKPLSHGSRWGRRRRERGGWGGGRGRRRGEEG
jgi:hypothetical protein